MRELDSDPKKWSDDDRAWAAQRPEQYPDVAPKVGRDPSTITMTEGATTLGGNGGTPDDDYETWTIAELQKEAGDRDGLTKPTGEQAKKKSGWVDALRDWDRRHPAE